jgi:hypothetical protein
MMKRHQQILLGVLALQVILSIVVFWPRKAVTRSGEFVFSDLDVADVVGLSWVDNQGERMVLRKVEGSWVLPEAGDYPVNDASVTALLEKLARLSQTSVVARTEASHRPLQVSEDTFQRRLDLEVAGGKTTTLYLGSAPRYTATHFRVAGQVETYLTTELAVYDVNVRFPAWANTAYAPIDQASITRVVLENEQGSFEFVKDDDIWVLTDLAEDEEVSPGSTSALVRSVSTLSLTQPLGKTEDPAYGLESPQAVVRVYTEEGREHSLTVGARNSSDSSHVVKSSDSPYYVRVAEFNVLAWVENDRADFLVEPGALPDIP